MVTATAWRPSAMKERLAHAARNREADDFGVLEHVDAETEVGTGDDDSSGRFHRFLAAIASSAVWASVSRIREQLIGAMFAMR
jgi:hypothetical protein